MSKIIYIKKHKEYLNKLIGDYKEGKNKDYILKTIKTHISYYKTKNNKRKEYSLRTKSVNMSYVKSYIKEFINDEGFINKIKLLQKNYDEITNLNIKRDIIEKEVILTKDYLTNLFNLKYSEYPHEKMIWVLFITGRRYQEVIKSDFKVNGEYLLNMNHILKKRGEKDGIFKTLYKAKEVLEIIREIKDYYEINYNNKGINAFRKVISRRYKKLLKKWDIKLNNEKLHFLRSANVCYVYKFRTKTRQRRDIVYSEQLLHAYLSSATNAYNKCKIEFRKDILADL